MKKLLIACSMISACALVACADAVTTTFTGTPKVEVLDWFAVTTTATNHGTLAIAEGSDALCEVTSDSKFEIDSDLANPVVFTSEGSLTQELSEVSFTLDPAIVPTDALQDFSKTETAPKVAFALYQADESTKEFRVWVGGTDWITLTGDNVTFPTEGTPYTLLMEFDNRAATKLVRFSVDNKVLKNDSTEWIAYAGIANAAMTINFVGCGKVTSFLGNQLNILAEVVVIGDKGTVEVNKAAKAAFAETIKNKTEYPSVDAFLAANAVEAFSGTSFQAGLKVAEAYALGLVETNSAGAMVAKDNGALKVKANAQAITEDGSIPVLLNIVPPTDSGATITYQLLGSVDGDKYEKVGAATEEQSEIKIPTVNIGSDADGKKYRFFKVVTEVTLESAN